VFFTHAREALDFHYERKLYDVAGRKLADPRVVHRMILAVDDFGNELQSAAIAYGRRHDASDPLLTAEDRANQGKSHVTYTESAYTNPIFLDDAYRSPFSAEVLTYELIKVTPAGSLPDITNLFGFEEMVGKVAQAGDGQHDLPYEDLDAAGAIEAHPYRRPIEHVRALYRKDDLSSGLPLGILESRALPFQRYKLAFTPGLLTLYQRGSENLLPNTVNILGGGDGGYVLSDDKKALGLFPSSDPDGHWWIPSGQVFYSPNKADTPTQELVTAEAHFFLVRRFRDPFGNDAAVLYDGYDLLVLETEDALQNKVTAGERAADGSITHRNDYRVLQPALLTDPNGNRSEAMFDALGLVAGTAVMGKENGPDGKPKGDSLANFRADLTQQEIDQFFCRSERSVRCYIAGKRNHTHRLRPRSLRARRPAVLRRHSCPRDPCQRSGAEPSDQVPDQLQLFRRLRA
jgi:hypothetical protein